MQRKSTMYGPTGTWRRNLRPFRRRSRRRRQSRSSASVGEPRIARARERWFAETPLSVFISSPQFPEVRHHPHPAALRASTFSRRGKGLHVSRFRKRPSLSRQLLQQRRRLEVVAELGLKL